MHIFDFVGNKVEVDVDLESPDVLWAAMSVLSGDEVLGVMYRRDDGYGHVTYEYVTYDSSSIRIEDFYDGSYVLFAEGRWFVDKDKFMSRTSSYWREDLED